MEIYNDADIEWHNANRNAPKKRIANMVFTNAKIECVTKDGQPLLITADVERIKGEWFLWGLDRIVSPANTPWNKCCDGYRFKA